MLKPEVEVFHHADTGTFSYVVHEPDGRAAAIIDPVLDYDPAAASTNTESADQIAAFVSARKLDVLWILETHAHADHVTAAPYLQKRLGGLIGISSGIAKVQAKFRDELNLGAALPTDGSQFDRLFDAGETFDIGTMKTRVIPTPGHTPDSVSYLVGDAVFVGDSLFMPDAGTARCDFPGGDARLLWQSTRRLFELPDVTRMFVCHDYGPGGREVRFETTVGEQKNFNIHVGGGRSEDEFVAMRTKRDAGLGMPRLILPAIQINIRAGHPPDPEDNGVSYLKIPLNRL
ncbi:MBL fold metallo-hydrolase [Wenzhouxiangella sediminis]|uniref:MBL fold metallo-hydrolase n=1 Tax=Wenzhouxiangella sediminis TaxID=1792836 RepID=A0A3E1K6Q3_9GAMM|nr:MBL fold metallo-hydrolase [Wenzhouxiangella sediminis]RFF29694.1 MBL fold metallo-hydrolase [Wenzhouxiangella sediminis]